MKSLIAFIKKELTEQIRMGKLLFLGALFTVLGIMNPAVAKLTPWLLEAFSDFLADSGITVTEVTVSAMDSWVQFFKNIPIGLIAFVLLQGSIFTREYASGTLTLSLTKGLKRHKVVCAKAAILYTLWTLGYFLCFAITYAYNSFFWDNSVAESLGLSVICWWIFGLLVISLMILLSVLLQSGTSVLIGTGGAVLVFYIVGMIPKVNKYLPTMLTDGNSLIYGAAKPSDYIAAIIITSVSALACFAVSIPIFNKKQL